MRASRWVRLSSTVVIGIGLCFAFDTRMIVSKTYGAWVLYFAV
jgi:hypothetical protein